MSKSFVASVLSTKKQRQRFYFFRNFFSVALGLVVFKYFGGTLGIVLGISSVFFAYLSIAAVLAFVVCFIEQMAS